MDSVFSRFDSYDFDNDVRFQEGLKKVNILETNKDVLKLKIFFYNRFVEAIDLIGFQEWSAGHRSDQSVMCDVEADAISVKDRFAQSDEIRASGERPQSETKLDAAQFVPLSFAEVFRMIQTGEEIPGLLNLDIKPCNQLPTVSHMSRKLKPWEK
ncbi:hypothetical protein P4O66_022980 [Electrophorus voltai]|uniref:Uncharacterized protein n=1 Tax=Electrophorus voltai TaxID=2609070 RepID=A0AAD8ZNG9_9TELE|nr:hypothetical protein P4O66_022980 [Electrophorus voltai]